MRAVLFSFQLFFQVACWLWIQLQVEPKNLLSNCFLFSSCGCGILRDATRMFEAAVAFWETLCFGVCCSVASAIYSPRPTWLHAEAAAVCSGLSLLRGQFQHGLFRLSQFSRVQPQIVRFCCGSLEVVTVRCLQQGLP